MIRDEPTPLNLPEPAGALAMQPHAHDPLTAMGLFGLTALLDVVAHQGLTVLTVVSMTCAILYGGFNCYINWRNSEARLAKFETQCRRRWEAQRDRK